MSNDFSIRKTVRFDESLWERIKNFKATYEANHPHQVMSEGNIIRLLLDKALKMEAI